MLLAEALEEKAAEHRTNRRNSNSRSINNARQRRHKEQHGYRRVGLTALPLCNHCLTERLLYAFRSHQFRALLSAPSRTTARQLAPNSVQSSSLLTVRLHRLDFYVVLRKLIAKLQAFPQCIQETSMVRFYSSIHSDDKMLIRQMSCDSAFHGSPNQIPAAHRTMVECLAAFPTLSIHTNLIRVGNLIFLARRYEIRCGCCRSPLH